MSDQISISLTSPARRILLLLTALLFLAAFILVFRWCLADSAATRAGNIEIAEFTAQWAPDDPQTHYTVGVLYEKAFLPDSTTKAVQSYEKAAALAPFDFRFWLPLAQARERDGDSEGAEKTLRRALELAPNYAQIHWTMGNMLLRQGRTEEAFAEMKRALEGNSMFAATAAATALQFSDEAPSLILEKLGNSRDARIAMAISLARQNKFDPAVEIWNSIDKSANNERDEKFAEKETEFSNILLMSKKFRYARQIKPTAERDDGGLSNPGFEQDLDLSGTSPFHWKISEGAQPRIGFDEQQKYSGKRSLGIVFPKGSGKDFRMISQTVVVEANRSYNLNLRFRSDITTTGGLRWEIADAATGDILGGTKDISAKNGEWELLTAAFKTPAQTEAVIVRLVRTGCQNCSIEGKLWFDDFSLGS